MTGRPGDPATREDEGELGVTPRAGSRAPYIALPPAAMLGGGARRACPPRPPRAAVQVSTSELWSSSALRAPNLHGAGVPARIAGVISSDLLEVLACPKCKEPVELDEERRALV